MGEDEKALRSYYSTGLQYQCLPLKCQKIRRKNIGRKSKNINFQKDFKSSISSDEFGTIMENFKFQPDC